MLLARTCSYFTFNGLFIQTLAKLEKFAQSLANKLRAPARGNSEDNAADESGWLSYQLKFASDHAKGKVLDQSHIFFFNY